ncbi:type VI secretion system-associated FHA domain protein TagH [Undibacterium arcticum]|uniref:type VI secretion system-associated FHA domain protein TagH n=1 Tax=Undibacterium arcticum TaxID=1762892 RepID=UPI00360E9ED9
MIPSLKTVSHQSNDRQSGASPMSDQHSFEPNPRADVNNIASQDPAHQELLDAFMRGAGIAQDPAGRGIGSKLTPELMEMLGKLLSVSIRGTHNLLSSRSMVKRAVQADVTVVVKRNNNPLKFLQDSDTIILQMLRKKMPGFMEPVEAMQEAYGDLYAHQKAMLAGFSAGVRDAMDRFHPRHISDHVPEPIGMDKWFPSRHKAQMWDAYGVRFRQIRKEGIHHEQPAIGNAFLNAYERNRALRRAIAVRLFEVRTGGQG